MISMWDESFTQMNPAIKNALESENGELAFELMHSELLRVWKEVSRVLIPGGYACINIGDATRTIAKEFRLYPNHSKILEQFMKLGFDILPEIIWRKPTNSPTKFLGSGMLPCGAYVTLEHEYILILRKPTKRKFDDDRLLRQESSYFWEERNKWFSDLWEVNGVKQAINGKEIRKRTAAYPLEIPLRLIRMFSTKNDVILDPFSGTATTALAAIITNRNSVSYERQEAFKELHRKELPDKDFISAVNSTLYDRVTGHIKEINSLISRGIIPKYKSRTFGFPVMTKQEIEIAFEEVNHIMANFRDDSYIVSYKDLQWPEVSTRTGPTAKSTLKRRMPRLSTI
jgi:modification methylase